ncbi:U4/U6 snRNA-associated-splicing factor PRP24 [Xylariales sp. PMI_506]|nr:U4/U6 snRNA-associated-splicing factor PRP24 [Xylariales sp. PMI_506]
MANPVGEDSWLAYVEEETRHASDLEGRVKVVELFKKAIMSEPGSLKIWLGYCEYFWSLFMDCQSSDAGWPEDEQHLGRELFPFESALSLWSEGYENIKYRLNDSHEFWNRWVSIEQEQLARTRTPVGVKRITHLFRDRLQVPHAKWDETSQMFSSFLSTYNNAAYESEFKEVTAASQGAKEMYAERESRELQLVEATKAGDVERQKAVMKEYLDWEMVQTIKKTSKNTALSVTLSLALYSRALTGVFAFSEDIWINYVVYLSSLSDSSKLPQAQYLLPDTLNVLQRATSHCPWSGMLWSRYILSAEEAGWEFHDMEHIKHAATNAKSLDKNGMTSVIEMYAAWCGYLKRTATNHNANEDAVDIADVGLLAALEDVQLWGERLYKDEYRGDPNYRIERILVQYLTEKKGEVEESRALWDRMASKPLLANSYDFWLNYYLWEMMIFSSQPRQRSPTPATPVNGTKPTRVPSLATNILTRALQQRNLDWPERVMEVYHQHCNDYERPETLRRALDTIHKTKRGVERRRTPEQQASTASTAEDTASQDSPSSSKRKRGETPESAHPVNKRPKNAEVNGIESAAAHDLSLKRDRENTSVMIQNLPVDVNLTALRKYFKDYGHILSSTIRKEDDGESASALIEFESPEEMRSALLRDQKYFGSSQITVTPGTGLTIYVTNYPPSADEEYIRSLFKDCGEVFGIRFPSLKYNTHRRFCYISFRDADGAAKATKLDGKFLEGKYRLLAKYSDPARKKQREGAVSEGRELRVKNIDTKTTEADLQAMFGKYGEVQSVRIIKNVGGQNVGTAYVVMENAEQAAKAAELDKTKLRSNILEVTASKEVNYKPSATTKGNSPAPAKADDDVTMGDDGSAESARQGSSPSDINARTMAIMNLPDTVNDTRVRAIAEKQGDIVKLVLRPNQEGATVEYKDIAAVGRAMLSVAGLEIDGRKLRTGTVADLFRERPGKKDLGSGNEKKSDKKFMPPPQTIRRPGLGSVGRPKQKLGFVASKKEPETNGTGPSGKPKSNADFKAMFLGEKKA